MTGERIAFSIANRVARIDLARPEKRNAMDGALIAEFAAAARACEADRSLAAIVIGARGEWFSAGGDLNDFLAHRDGIFEHVRASAGELHAAVLALQRACAPVIVAVGGMAAGAGFALVCGADLVVASEAARFIAAYTRSGLTPDGGTTFFLPRIVGRRTAFDLLATNPILSAAEAKALGIVSRVVPHDALDSEVESLVDDLAGQPEGAIAGLKALFRHGEAALTAHLEMERESIAAMAARPSTLARMEAFLKPKPR